MEEPKMNERVALKRIKVRIQDHIRESDYKNWTVKIDEVNDLLIFTVMPNVKDKQE